MKNKRLNFRITDEVDGIIRRKAEEAGMTITDYVIAAAVGKQIICFHGLEQVVTQLKKLGNNLNQLVVLARQGQVQVIDLTDMQQEFRRIYELLARLLRWR